VLGCLRSPDVGRFVVCSDASISMSDAQRLVSFQDRNVFASQFDAPKQSLLKFLCEKRELAVRIL
jgi:hypothetical protein